MKVAIISTIIEIAEIDETNMPGETEGEKLQNLKEEAQSDLHNMIEDGETIPEVSCVVYKLPT